MFRFDPYDPKWPGLPPGEPPTIGPVEPGGPVLPWDKPKGWVPFLPCESKEPLEYDWSVSPQTIIQSSQATVAVTGGRGPFLWSITGTGFSLESSETETRSNVVYTDDTACGSGEITVTDACEELVTGEIRCTVGGWQNYAGEDFCPIPGPSDSAPGLPDGNICQSGLFQRTLGKWNIMHCYHWTIQYNEDDVNDTCPVQCPGPCLTHCFNTSSYCHQTLGCTECLTYPTFGLPQWIMGPGMCGRTSDQPCEYDITKYAFTNCFCLSNYGGNFIIREWKC